MRRIVILIIALTCVVFSVSGVQAQIELSSWGFNVDGTTYCLNEALCNNNLTDPGGLPSFINPSNFFDTGLGSVNVNVSGAGNHTVIGFFDYDLGTDFDDEIGAASGTPMTGQAWEIDEPGFGSSQLGSEGDPYVGDIFENFLDDLLDNDVFVDNIGGQFLVNQQDDASMAIGWDFDLNAGEIAQIDFTLSSSQMPAGFHLKQTHSNKDDTTVYFSSAKTVVPEPISSVLFITGGAVFAGRRFLKRKRL